MFCEKCGTEIPKNARFCEKCGTPVEPVIQEVKEESPHKKWILWGIAGGIILIALIIVLLFVTGVFGPEKESTQVSTEAPSVTGVSETAVPSTEPTVIPTIAPTSSPEPTEIPVENAGGNESEKPTEEDVSDENVQNSEYIFPNSDSEYLTKSDVKNLSASEINLAKNELYARHGRKFDRDDLQEHFEECSWYTPIYTAEEWDEYGDSYFFNEYEIKNRNLLKKWENKKK